MMQETDEIEIVIHDDQDLTETDEVQPTLEELLALPHPLEQHPELLALVTQHFPDKGYEKLLLDAIKPGISNHPDELEKWEAEAILRRKQKLSGDFGIAHLIRILYEETFSVRQFQGEKFSSEGATIGGLLSHHYFGGSIDGVTIEDIPELPQLKETFQEEFEELIATDDTDSLDKLVTLAAKIAFPHNYDPTGFYSIRIKQQLLRTRKYFRSEAVEIIAYRMIKILHDYPELLEKSDKTDLNKVCETSWQANLTFFVDKLWGLLGHAPGVFFTDRGVYKHEITDELLAGLEKLIQFRTNPDTQVLYRYLSPSGYSNANKQ